MIKIFGGFFEWVEDKVNDALDDINTAYDNLVDDLGDWDISKLENPNIIDPGDWGPSVVKGLETVVDTVENTVEAIADKPVQFIIQAAVGTFAPSLAPIVNGAIAASNGATPLEILKSTVLTAVTPKVAEAAGNYTSDFLTNVDINSNLTTSISNIAEKYTEARLKGGDAELSLVTTVLDSVRTPIQETISEFTKLIEGIEVDIDTGEIIDSELEEAIKKGVDAFIDTGTVSGAVTSLVAEQITPLIDGFSDLAGANKAQIQTAITAAVTAGLEGGGEEAVNAAYYGSLAKSSGEELGALLEKPITNFATGMLESLGFIQKKDGTLVNKNNIIVDGTGQAVKGKDGEPIVWKGGFREGEQDLVFIFNDGSAIELGDVFISEVAEALNPKMFQSAEEYTNALRYKVNQLRAVPDQTAVESELNKIEKVINGVSIYEGALPADIVEKNSVYTEKQKRLISGMSKANSVADLTAYVQSDDLLGSTYSEYKLDEEVTPEMVRNFIDHNDFNSNFLLSRDSNVGQSSTWGPVDGGSFKTGDEITSYAINEHNELAKSLGADDLVLNLKGGDTLSSTDAAKLMLGTKLGKDSILALNKLVGKDAKGNVTSDALDAMSRNEVLQLSSNIVTDDYIDATTKKVNMLSTEGALNEIDQFKFAWNDLNEGLINAGNSEILKKIFGDDSTFLAMIQNTGIQGLEMGWATAKGYQELKKQGIETIYGYDPKSETDLTLDFLNQTLQDTGGKVATYVSLTQEKQDQYTKNMSDAAKKLFEDNVASGDIKFKYMAGPNGGAVIPVDVSGVSFGEDPSFEGTMLKASGGVMDILADVLMFSSGPLGATLGVAQNTFEAAGAAASQIEKTLNEQLDNPEFTNSQEWKNYVAKHDGQEFRAIEAMMRDAKKVLLPTGLVGTVVDRFQVALIMNPISKWGVNAFNKLAGAAGVLGSEFIGEGAEEALTNYGIATGLQKEGQEFWDIVGLNNIGAGIEGTIESLPAAGTVLALPGHKQVLKDISPAGQKLMEEAGVKFETVQGVTVISSEDYNKMFNDTLLDPLIVTSDIPSVDLGSVEGAKIFESVAWRLIDAQNAGLDGLNEETVTSLKNMYPDANIEAIENDIKNIMNSSKTSNVNFSEGTMEDNLAKITENINLTNTIPITPTGDDTTITSIDQLSVPTGEGETTTGTATDFGTFTSGTDTATTTGTDTTTTTGTDTTTTTGTDTNQNTATDFNTLTSGTTTTNTATDFSTFTSGTTTTTTTTDTDTDTDTDKDQDKDTDKEQDTQINPLINTLITTQVEDIPDEEEEEEEEELFETLGGASQAGLMKVTTPEPGDIDYIYDFSSIFPNPKSEELLPTPYAPEKNFLDEIRNIVQKGPYEDIINPEGEAEKEQKEKEEAEELQKRARYRRIA